MKNAKRGILCFQVFRGTLRQYLGISLNFISHLEIYHHMKVDRKVVSEGEKYRSLFVKLDCFICNDNYWRDSVSDPFTLSIRIFKIENSFLVLKEGSGNSNNFQQLDTLLWSCQRICRIDELLVCESLVFSVRWWIPWNYVGIVILVGLLRFWFWPISVLWLY